MKQFLFTIKEEIFTANGKNAEQPGELLNKMTEYGTVVPYDQVVNDSAAEMQKTIDDLVAQNAILKAENEALAEQIVSADDKKILNAVHARIDAETAVFKEENAKLVLALDDERRNAEDRSARVEAFLKTLH